MKTRWTFDGVQPADRERCERYWEEKKARRIERLLSHLPRPQDLYLAFHALPQTRGTEGRARLSLPTGVLVVHGRARTLPELVDLLADKLVHKLKTHRERLREHWVARRKVLRAEETRDLHDLLAADRAAQRREAFYEVLRPLLRPLEKTLRFELDHLIEEGKLGRGQVGVNDIRDEILLRAWNTFEERPPHQPIDLWLRSLGERVLAELTEEPGRIAMLQATAEEGNEPEPVTEELEDSDLVWADVLSEHDTPLIEDLLPADEYASGLATLEVDELRELVETTLRRELDPPQRRAILAWLFEGRDLAEIAMIQDRSPEEVQADIDLARAILRDKLAVSRPS